MLRRYECVNKLLGIFKWKKVRKLLNVDLGDFKI